MSFIKLRLIGLSPDNDYKINYESNSFTLQSIYDHLILNNMNIEHITKIRFISSCKNITNIDEENEIVDDNHIIYLIINDEEVRTNLLKNIFKNMIDITKPLFDTPISESDSESDSEECENNINIYNDPDFVNLLRICINKPHLLNTVNNYMSHGDIVGEININYDETNFMYNDELEIINKLGLPYNNIIPIQALLNFFKGNINMTIRYMLYKFI
jgi:hypothetical protein